MLGVPKPMPMRSTKEAMASAAPLTRFDPVYTVCINRQPLVGKDLVND